MGKFWRSLCFCIGESPTENVSPTVGECSQDEQQRIREVKPVKHFKSISTQTNFEPEKKQNSESRKSEPISSVDVILSESPRIVYARGVSKSTSRGLFIGTFENRKVSVKRMPWNMNFSVIKEANLMSKIDNNENIIRYYCTVQTPENIFIITDRYSVSLRVYMQFHFELEISTREIIQQLTNAVDFLHQRKIIYLNLNPDNIHVVLVNEFSVIKLTNFEFSEIVEVKHDVSVQSSFIGVEDFNAPEILSRKEACLMSDIYSLGCLFYFVITQGKTLQQIKSPLHEQQIAAGLYTLQRNINSCDYVLCIDMMTKMVSFHIYHRPTINEVKSHVFFKSAQEVFDLIIEVRKELENEATRKDLQCKLQVNKNQIIGSNWKDRIDEKVYNEICKARQYDGRSIYQLVQAIRNQIVHKRCSIEAEAITGKSKEELRNYWLLKFPKLIPHLSKVMQAHRKIKIEQL